MALIIWNRTKFIFPLLFNMGIILMLAFNVVTMLPVKVFAIKSIHTGIELSAAIILFLGAFAQLIKRYTIGRMPTVDRGAEDIEWKHLLSAALFLTILAFLTSLTIFIMNFFIHKLSSHLETKLYFCALSLLLLVTYFSPSQTLASYENDQDETWHKCASFIIDHYLISVYVAIYVQINFLEAKETLELYAIQDRECSNGTENHSANNKSDPDSDDVKNNYTNLIYKTVHAENSHQAMHYWNELLRTACFAMVVEIMILLFVAHVEQRRVQQDHPIQTKSNDPNELILSDNDRDPESPLSNDDGDFKLIPYKPSVDIPLAIFGMLSALSILSIWYTIVTKNVGKHGGGQSQNLALCKLVFYGSFAVYQCSVFWVTGASRSTPKLATDKTLDIKLLRWSMYFFLLFIGLILAATAYGSVDPGSKSLINFLNSAFNAFQICVQFLVIFHLEKTKEQITEVEQSDRDFEMVGRAASCMKKLRIHLAPIFLANVGLWLFDLWQWKAVAMLDFPANTSVSPGPVWAVIEALLFPPMIFFRFHSAFMCYMIFRISAKANLARFGLWFFQSLSGSKKQHTKRNPEEAGAKIALRSTNRFGRNS